MWGYHAAHKYLFPAFKSHQTQDPELAMMGYWRKHFANDMEVHYYKQCTTDVGRHWQDKNSIKKWVREDMVNKSAVTYSS